MKAPAPDKKLYDMVMQSGFDVYPQRKKNYDRYLAGDRSAFLSYLPVKMDIEPTSRCNLKCEMCLMKDWDNGGRAKDLSFEDFKYIIDEQYGLIEIKLQGLGEPLLNKDLHKMIEYARKRHIWVRSTTNGSLLHYNDNYKKLIDSDISEIQVSIDGVTADVFESIRKGADFSKICDNCKLLNDYCRSENKMRSRMWVVVQKKNFHQLYDFPQLAKDLGFERLSLSLELSDWGKDEWQDRNGRASVDIDNVSIDYDKLTALGTENQVDISFWTLSEKYSSKSKDTLCPWPFNRAYISSDMRIVPCCKICDPRYVDFGSAYDFSKVWFDKNYSSFRMSHINGRIPEYCKTCYRYEFNTC